MMNDLTISPAVLLVEMNDKELKVKSCNDHEIIVWCHDELDLTDDQISMKFFNVDEYAYTEVKISDFEVTDHTFNDVYWEYRITIHDEKYSVNYRKIIEQLDSLKRFDDSCTEFYEDHGSAKREFFGESLKYDDQKDIIGHFQKSFVIENYDDYRMFLDMKTNDLILHKLKNYNLEGSFLPEDFSRVYIGNQFCHNLFPSDDILIKLMDRALADNLDITIAFTYIREIFIGKVSDTVNKIFEWCVKNDTRVEILVNDWGMLRLLADKRDKLIPVLGVLLNKRKKDPRTDRKIGVERFDPYLKENNLNSEYLIDFLKSNGIERIEYESHGVENKYAPLKASISYPFYQTNTSQYCPLYAQCVNLNRNYQKLVTSCPQYCRKFVMMFPKNVKAVGRYNSIFGIDNVYLQNIDMLRQLADSDVDRLVLNI